jgi:predicted amidophosphoribosyltransferase
MNCGYCEYPKGYEYRGELTKGELEHLHPFTPNHALYLCWKDHFLTHEVCSWCGSTGKPIGKNCPTCTHNETPEEAHARRMQYNSFAR